jgi:hypothetical protein
MSKWIHSFPAKSPYNQPDVEWRVGIHANKFERLRKSGHEAKLARLALVGEVVGEPLFILDGWGRPEKDDCFVYVGKPAVDYRRVSIQTPAPPGQLFLVFVLPDGTIDDWNWRPTDLNDPSRPEGMRGKTIWPTT